MFPFIHTRVPLISSYKIMSIKTNQSKQPTIHQRIRADVLGKKFFNLNSLKWHLIQVA